MGLWGRFWENDDSMSNDQGELAEEATPEIKMGDLPLEEKTRLLNVFINNEQIRVGAEYVESILEKCGLSKYEVENILLVASGGKIKERLPVPEEDYLESLRQTIVDYIKRYELEEV